MELISANQKVLAEYTDIYHTNRCLACKTPLYVSLRFSTAALADDMKSHVVLYHCQACGLAYTYPFAHQKALDGLYKNYSGYTHDLRLSGNILYKILVRLEMLVMQVCLSGRSLLIKNICTSPIFSYLFQTYPLYTTAKNRKPKILDIGCGGGHFLTLAKMAGAGVYGTEIDALLVKRLNARGIHAYMNLTPLRTKRITFDVIRINQVLEHLIDPNTVLQDAHRLLAKNGELVIGVPNYNTPARVFGMNMFLHIPFHRLHFTKRAITKLLNTNGFDVLYLRTKSSGVFSRSLLRALQTESSIYTIALKLLEVLFISLPLDLLGIGDGLEIYAKKR